MDLYTSSSNMKHREAIFYSIFAMGCIIIAAVNAYLYHHDFLTRDEETYWKGKIISTPRYDMVAMGDSRTYFGINPEIMERILGGKMYNNAFSAGGLNREIFEYVGKNVLRHDAGKHQRFVLLGVTTYNLSKESHANTHYHSLLRDFTGLTADEKISNILLRRKIMKRFEDLKEFELGGTKLSQRKFHESGWLEFNVPISPKQQKRGFAKAEKTFKRTTFDPTCLEEMVQWTRQLNSQHVLVFAYRPPTLLKMDLLEDEKSGCDMRQVRREMEDAGAIWLDVKDRYSYEAFDASHLNTAGATRLSTDLARQIQAYLKTRKDSRN